MCDLNFGLWNSTNLHTFKLININLEDRVIHLKRQILENFHIDEIDRIELLYCGHVMVNEETVSTYIRYNDEIIFVIKKNDPIKKTMESHTEEHLDNMLAVYSKAFRIPEFEEIFLNAMNPETIATLVANIPELSTDSIALSIMKDAFLLKTLLEPSALKIQMKKHPALLLAAHYLIENVLQETLGKKRWYSSLQLTDEDFSDGDGIELSYVEQILDHPATSAFSPITSLQLASALANANIRTQRRTENGDFFQIPPIENSFLNSPALRDVLVDQHNQADGSADIRGLNTTTLSHELHQMHEMGLENDLLNFSALEVAEGDVQGAIELILNGIID